jgi:hypothetical protein
MYIIPVLQIESINFSTSFEAKESLLTVVDRWKRKNDPFLLKLCANRFEKIFLDPREDIPMRNLKKAIAALFQVCIAKIFSIDRMLVRDPKMGKMYYSFASAANSLVCSIQIDGGAAVTMRLYIHSRVALVSLAL